MVAVSLGNGPIRSSSLHDTVKGLAVKESQLKAHLAAAQSGEIDLAQAAAELAALRDEFDRFCAVRNSAYAALTARMASASQDLNSMLPGLRRDFGEDLLGLLMLGLSDPDHGVCSCCLQTLSLLGSQAMPAVSTALRLLTDPRQDVIASARVFFSEMNARSVPILIDVMGSPDAQTRFRAAYAVSIIGPPARSAVPSLIHLLKDPEAPVREKAAIALSQIGAEAQTASPTLAELVEDETDDTVRYDFIFALGEIRHCDPAILTAITRALEDPCPAVRERAATVLGKMGAAAAGALSALQKARDSCASPDDPVFKAAESSIYRISSAGVGSADNGAMDH